MSGHDTACKGALRPHVEGWNAMIILGLILLLIGLIAKIAILETIGVVLLAVGLVLMLVGRSGRAIGGRRHYF